MEIVGAALPRYVLRRSMKNRGRLDGVEGALAGQCQSAGRGTAENSSPRDDEQVRRKLA